ncbi:uncharacterized protein DSM5745_10466 [Aspergillus mulundensis]|uniref:Uncharacterized protein n=1 Tax=Aspergillus mulundensis TaxID=1810919 RepID=A0A3D8QK36_9EURO|nr:hypothetical protein DSM5745_10466 [Aspergillus mulundensis]RDW61794.1 hypothetical protein DSM5745_10466 [Aspergillus mulundensis]
MPKRKPKNAGRAAAENKKAKEDPSDETKIEPLDQDFELLGIPSPVDEMKERGICFPERYPRGYLKGTAKGLAAELENKVASWSEKYAVNDMAKLEKKLSSKQWGEVIQAAATYCAQCPVDLLKGLLPSSVYRRLPELLAHAIVNRTVWRIVQTPFYFVEPEYLNDKVAKVNPFVYQPPAGFGLYLRQLFQTTMWARREDTIKWRQLLLRSIATHTSAVDLHCGGGMSLSFEMQGRMDTAKEKLTSLLLQGPLHLLLKHSSISKEQRNKLADIIMLATKFSIVCGITDKEFNFRLFDQLPLYGSRHSRMMEPDATSKAAQSDKDVDRVLENRLVVLTLRPVFTYKIGVQRMGPPSSEHVVAKAIVVLAKKEAPRPVVDEATHAGPAGSESKHHLFSNLDPGVADKLKKPFKHQFNMYDDDGDVASSNITPLGTVMSSVIKDE